MTGIAAQTFAQTPDNGRAISIVIISRERPILLRRHLDDLRQAIGQREDVEIVVVEECRMPQEPPPGVRYVALAPLGQGFGFARNEGLNHARGGIVVFLDDDVRVCPGWLDRLTEPFADPAVGAVGGAVLPEPDGLGAIGGAIGLLGFPAGGLGRVLAAQGRPVVSPLISSGNCAVRRSVADAVGGFDSLLRWGGEDQAFFQQIGQRSITLYEPRAVVWHQQRDTLRRVWRWARRRGRAEFGLRLNDGSAMAATVAPLRSNFLIKCGALLAAVAVAGLVSPLVAGLVGLVATAAWARTIDRRCVAALRSVDLANAAAYRALASRLTVRPVRRWLPLVRWCMDAGREVGRWEALARYLRCRWVDKPMVVTFHHVAAPPQEAGPGARRYFYAPHRFARFNQALADEGRLLMGLPEMLDRLERSPQTLFAEPLVALTFDDAYVSACRTLADSPAAVRRASLVFVPTGCLGGDNRWDNGPGWPRQPVADPALIAAVADLGVALGSHSRDHVDLTACSARECREQVTGARSDLLPYIPTGTSPVFSYPFGRYNRSVATLVRDAGHAGAVANFDGRIDRRIDRFQLPRFSVDCTDDWAALRRRSRRRWARELAKAVPGLNRWIRRFRRGPA